MSNKERKVGGKVDTNYIYNSKSLKYLFLFIQMILFSEKSKFIIPVSLQWILRLKSELIPSETFR